MKTVNNPNPVDACRSPIGMVKVNDEIVPGWIEWEVENNTFYQADSFRVCLALNKMSGKFDGSWWSKQRTASVEIFAGFQTDQQGPLDSLIFGNVDEIEIDPTQGVVELHGRDLTSLLIDNKVTDQFRNRKAWQIAETLAKRHGLKPVITKTNTYSGAYYQIDSNRLAIQQSEWDLLAQEAHKERYVVYIKGRELHFKPFAKPSDEPYLLKWQPPTDEQGFPVFNGISLRFQRALTVAKGVVVKVSSWNPKTKKKYSVTYPAGHAKGISPGQSTAPATVYPLSIPALLPEKAMQRAEAYHREITQHEMKLLADLPGDNLLRAGMPVKVSGTGMEFDQTYYADSVHRRMSMDSGYVMTVTAKNVSPGLADMAVGSQ